MEEKNNLKNNKLFKLTIIIIIIIAIIIIINICLSVIGIKTYIVLSGSMEPNIKIGDLIIVKQYKIEDIQKGDIITFEIDDKIITHRIIEIKDGKYITKGDNNNVEDDFSVRVENIKGKFVLSLPKIGDLMLTIKNNIYFFLISLIIIIIYEIKK